MSEQSTIERGTPPTVSEEALEELPIFPLEGTLLLPQTVVSLHVFEPRYRRMIEDIAEGHRTLAIALLDEGGRIDRFGRPPIFPIAGCGILRRSARLPDGRFNVLIEGVTRVDIREELDPRPFVPYRRVRARRLVDVYPEDTSELASAASALRALCACVVSEMASGDSEVMQRLNEITDPGQLADMVAAATIQEPHDRQRILAELDVVKRLELAAGSLGTLCLRATDDGSQLPQNRWGMRPARG